MLAEVHRQLKALDDFWRFHCVGRFRGSIVLLMVDRDLVRQLLPQEDLQLIDLEENVAPRGHHPVIILLGSQRDVHFRDEDGAVRSSDMSNYDEVVPMIPYVQWKRDIYPYRGPLAFPPVLYVDRWLPIGLGKLCGYNKKLAEMTVDSYSKFSAEDQHDGRGLISGAFQSMSDWSRPKDFDTFRMMKKMLRQPVVGSYESDDELPLAALRVYACTQLIFDFKKSQMQSIDAKLSLQNDFCGDLAGAYDVISHPEKPLDAIQLRKCNWTLGAPKFPQFFTPEEPVDRGVYKKGRAAGTLIPCAVQSTCAALDLGIGAVSGIVEGMHGVRDNLTGDNLFRMSSENGLVTGVLEGAARCFDEMARGVRSATGQLGIQTQPRRARASRSERDSQAADSTLEKQVRKQVKQELKKQRESDQPRR